MSQEDIKNFYVAVIQDPAMKEQVLAAPDRQTLVTTAVKLGNEKGYSFTEQDVENWLTTSTEQSRPDGLSDTDLESIAGGKSDAEAGSHIAELAGGTVGPAGAIVGAITCTAKPIPSSMSVYPGAPACY